MNKVGNHQRRAHKKADFSDADVFNEFLGLCTKRFAVKKGLTIISSSTEKNTHTVGQAFYENYEALMTFAGDLQEILGESGVVKIGKQEVLKVPCVIITVTGEPKNMASKIAGSAFDGHYKSASKHLKKSQSL